MLFSVEQAFMGRDEKRAPLKMPAWEAISTPKEQKPGDLRKNLEIYQAKCCDLSVASRSIIWLRQIINYLAEANNKLICETLTNHDILRWPSSIIVLSFDHRVCLFNNYPWEAKQSDLPFSHRSDRKKEKSTVSFMYEQNIICSQTLLDGIAHEQTIICRQLFAGHLVGSRPMKRKKNLLRMIIIIIVF